jgi:hypothetical protein
MERLVGRLGLDLEVGGGDALGDGAPEVLRREYVERAGHHQSRHGDLREAIGGVGPKNGIDLR